MAKRISATDWSGMKKTMQHIVDNMTVVDVDVNQFNLFKRIRKRTSTKKKKPDNISDNQSLYGNHLGSILDWLDENSTHSYYAEINREASGVTLVSVRFYFMDDSDAMPFKLMFDER